MLPKLLQGWVHHLGPLVFCLMLAATAVSSHAQGNLANGEVHYGDIAVSGEVDEWSLQATAGDSLVIKIGELIDESGYFAPSIRLVDPNGAEVSTETHSVAAEIVHTATLTGRYQLFVQAGPPWPTYTGTYRLHLARIPGVITVPAGDEGGVLTNGAVHLGEIHIGDLDLWTFEAQVGDRVVLRLGELVDNTSYFAPWLRLYGPSGGLLEEAVHPVSAEIAFTVASSGIHTVVVAAGAPYPYYDGTYRLHLARIPGTITVAAGDEGGELSNGAVHLGEIHIGDLDLWTFEAQVGDRVVLRLGEIVDKTSYFAPWLRLYGPSGGLLQEAVHPVSAEIAITVASSGIHTVIVAAGAPYPYYDGTYRLSLARMPGAFVVSAGDEGGVLTNGVTQEGVLQPGDLDPWTFGAKAADKVVVRVGELVDSSSYFAPSIRLYGPDGILIEEAVGPQHGEIAITAASTGNYTVLVTAGAPYPYYEGSYRLHLAVIPGEPATSPGNEGGRLINGQVQQATNHVGDLDFYTFEATQGDTFSLRVLKTADPSTYYSLQLRLYDPAGTLIESDHEPSEIEVARTAPVTGRYSVLVNAGNPWPYYPGAYSVQWVRYPPDLLVPPTQTATEGTRLELLISAVDPLEPSKALEFGLVSGPAGLALTAAGPTNAVIAWTPGEMDGGTTNEVILKVTDVVGSQAYHRTNRFVIVVDELNNPPTLVPPGPVAIDELLPLRVTATATGNDLPADAVSFSLLSPPSGMTINPASGEIAWTPTEAQGASNWVIAVVATDHHPTAVNEKNLSVTNTFSVNVREVNLAPQLSKPVDSVIDELAPFTALAQATDADLPQNTLAYSLLDGPAGLTIDPVTGTMDWIPGEEQGPATHVVRIKATDNGVPALSATNEFQITLREVNAAPVLAALPDQQTADDVVFQYVVQASDPDRPGNTLLFELGAGAPAGVTLDPVSGLLTWPVGVKSAAETVTIPVKVSDNGSPVLSAQGELRVTITPAVLRLARVPDLQVNEGELLSLTAAVTNSPNALPPFSFAVDGELPAGASLNRGTGVLFWRPSEAQGPSTNTITLRVTDSATPANSAVQAFAVVVREVNTAPTLASLPPQAAVPGVAVSLTAQATDGDLPTNNLTYSLDAGAPAGMTISPTTGVIYWVPDASHAGTTNRVTIRATDDGTPAQSATGVLVIRVQALNQTRLAITSLPNHQWRITLTGDIGRTYLIERSSDLKNWEIATNFVSTATQTDLPPIDLREGGSQFYRALSP